jgi:hypothetical protein
VDAPCEYLQSLASNRLTCYKENALHVIYTFVGFAGDLRLTGKKLTKCNLQIVISV